uniref:IBB domain-containing protein n=1 Tax=Amphimedon queenslandica TaxID=400682 RepID=A0A1X7TLA7_AMPQE
MSQDKAHNSHRRELYRQRMAAETPEAREARLDRRRVTDRARRDAKTPEAREARIMLKLRNTMECITNHL